MRFPDYFDLSVQLRMKKEQEASKRKLSIINSFAARTKIYGGFKARIRFASDANPMNLGIMKPTTATFKDPVAIDEILSSSSAERS